MIPTVTIHNNLQQYVDRLTNEGRENFARQLSMCAASLRQKEMKEMDKLDRPTPFTKKGVVYQQAKPSTLAANVSIRPTQSQYLANLVYGNTVNKPKPVPSLRAKNKYGNLPRNATRRSRVFTLRVRRTGGIVVLQRKSKRNVITLAYWSKRRLYREGIYDFYGVARRHVGNYRFTFSHSGGQ